jgi:hypothetical protein
MPSHDEDDDDGGPNFVTNSKRSVWFRRKPVQQGLIRRPVAHSRFPLSCHASVATAPVGDQTASLQWVTEGRQIGISIIAYMGT